MTMYKQQGKGGIVRLSGKSVTLRTFTAANITPAYLTWLNHPELMKYSNQRFRRHDEASCHNYLASFEGSDNLFLAIYDEEHYVGTMTAYVSSPHQSADMGLLIGAQCQGRGLGKDAWATLMAHLFANGMRKIGAGTLRCNTAMLRVMQGSGMQPDGVRVAHELIDGQPQDILHYAKFRTP